MLCTSPFTANETRIVTLYMGLLAYLQRPRDAQHVAAGKMRSACHDQDAAGAGVGVLAWH